MHHLFTGAILSLLLSLSVACSAPPTALPTPTEVPSRTLIVATTSEATPVPQTTTETGDTAGPTNTPTPTPALTPTHEPTVVPLHTGKWYTWAEISEAERYYGIEGQVRTYLRGAHQSQFRMVVACRENSSTGGRDLVVNLVRGTGMEMHEPVRPASIRLARFTATGLETLSHQASHWRAVMNVRKDNGEYFSTWYASPGAALKIVRSLDQQSLSPDEAHIIDVEMGSHDYTLFTDGAENAIQPVLDACGGLP